MTTSTEAIAAALGANLVEGPLKGHHHEAYAVRLDAESTLGQRFGWLKLREPRPGVFWYDSRCFSSEEDLITALQGHVTRIPEVVCVDDYDQVTVHSFIEGRTLGSLRSTGTAITQRHFEQIGDLFRDLAAFDVAGLKLERICGHGDVEEEDDSTGFLRRLVGHTITHVYKPHRGYFRDLWAALGVPDDALQVFVKELPELTPRPYILLHGDLHRENFIIDRNGDLWTIDWELARIGDPLYDLATHLYLMQYPTWQEERMIRRWRAAVEEAQEGATQGYDEDLPQYLRYKRLQSVYTDVIRGATAIGDGRDERQLDHVAEVVARALSAASEPLGLTLVPSLSEIRSVMKDWKKVV